MNEYEGFIIPIYCIDCRKYFGELFGNCGDAVLFHRFQCHECILKDKPQ